VCASRHGVGARGKIQDKGEKNKLGGRPHARKRGLSRVSTGGVPRPAELTRGGKRLQGTERGMGRRKSVLGGKKGGD